MWGKEKNGAPSGSRPEPEALGPVTMNDLERLEHLAWRVDSGQAEAEEFVEAKLAVLARPPPDATVGPISHLALPTDELSALERLHGSGHLTDPEYETLRRRVILKL